MIMRKRKEHQPLEASDKAFFQQFYEENIRFIYHIAKGCSNGADCNDLVQNTLLRLMNNISTLKEIDRCKTATYIVLTVRTAYLDSERHKRKENLLFWDNESLEALMLEKLLPVDRDDELANRQAINKLKDVLSPREWCVLEGKYIIGLSQEELGSLIGVVPDSVRMVLHRARRKARSILEADAVMGGEEHE